MDVLKTEAIYVTQSVFDNEWGAEAWWEYYAEIRNRVSGTTMWEMP